MSTIDNKQHWQKEIEAFVSQLDQEPTTFHSVKNLCQFILRERWSDADQVLNYLQDFCSVSKAHLSFHEKWSHLTNMANIAAYDQREIEKLHELMELLRTTSTQ